VLLSVGGDADTESPEKKNLGGVSIVDLSMDDFRGLLT
uniref:Chitinase-like protein (Fragments) n=1 Tax=Heliothis virescens TaxID=7102 RepID=IDGF_HELVI|nr:RecName: Full=Chitinase-like protein; AltName: Full=Imaginal disk growth factor protein [Heliothis virescens]